MAAVMLKAKGTRKDRYRYDAKIRTISSAPLVYGRVCRAGDDVPQYSTAALLGLHVYDLYYKKLQNVQQWWQDMDGMGGTVTIGLLYEFAE